MCDVSLFCHLSCNRFVAASENKLVVQSQYGHKTHIVFDKNNVAHIQIFLVDTTGGIQLLADTTHAVCVAHSVWGQTAALAKSLLGESQLWYMTHKCLSGLGASIKDGVAIVRLQDIIACFCELQVSQQNKTSNTFCFVGDTTVSFNRKYVFVMFANHTSMRIPINGSGYFCLTAQCPCTGSDDARFNWDAYVAEICHTILAHQS